jgi:2',3'-cyclic-nucleotide 2'-phosphodiesterase (5'-nucleotidase family)
MERNVPVDGVMHGAFDDWAGLLAGPKTLNDIWNLIPYENYIVTARLSPEEIKTVMEEVFASHEKRNLLGFELKTQGRGNDCRIVSITLADGRPLDRHKKYDIAFNSFDSRSGGHHFMKLRALLERPEANYVLHPVQTRDALIDYFQRHKIVRRIAAGIPVEIAA